MRILIAEDSVLLRVGLERLLEGAGHEVVAAVDTAEALVRAAAEHRPDLAVVDVRMPPTFTDEGIRAAVLLRATPLGALPAATASAPAAGAPAGTASAPDAAAADAASTHDAPSEAATAASTAPDAPTDTATAASTAPDAPTDTATAASTAPAAPTDAAATHSPQRTPAPPTAQPRHPLPVLVLSQYVEERYAAELIAGNSAGLGYLLKDRVADVAEFLDAVAEVGAGGTVLDPEVVAQIVIRSQRSRELDALTARERETLQLMAEGRSNAAIAARMHVTEGSVEKFISSVFAKLGLPTAESGNRRVLAVLKYLGADPRA